LVFRGNIIKSPDDAMLTINQIQPIYVSFAVPERYLPEIRRELGTKPLRVETSFAGMTAVPPQGELTFVDNSVDTTTGTVLLKAEFANRDNTLWPGEFLNVRLQLYVQDKALVVPAQAVMTGQQGTYVFLVNQDGTARSQPVTVARTAGQYAILAQGGGVQPGDQVVTDGQLRLVSGAPVEVKGGVSGAGGDVEADK